MPAIIFDMDGVLVDSEPVITEAAIRCLNRYGVHPVALDFKPFTGTGEDSFIGNVARKYGLEYHSRMKTETYDIYDTVVAEKLLIYPHVVTTLQTLHQAGIPMALCSSADLRKVLINLKTAGIDLSIFSALVTAEDVTLKKPAPDIFLKGAQKLAVDPTSCVVVEDALSGIQAAKSANCRAIGIPTSFEPSQLLQAGADAILLDFVELLTYFSLM